MKHHACPVLAVVGCGSGGALIMIGCVDVSTIGALAVYGFGNYVVTGGR